MITDDNSIQAYPHFDEFNHVDEFNNDEQRLRLELIERATTRLRRRKLEQGLQDVMHQVISLQTQLETLRIDAVTTIDTVFTIFDESNSPEGTQRMNRQMDVLERRLQTHKLGLSQVQEQKTQQQQQQKSAHQPTMLTFEAMTKTDSNFTSISTSRLSLVSSIFGRSSSDATSCATSVSGAGQSVLKQQQQEHLSALEDDDNISQIESIGNSGEDHPFYDLAGKRSFGAGSFCGSVYHDNHQHNHPMTIPAPCNNSADIRFRRRQRRQRHKQQLEQLQHPSEDEDSVSSDDVTTLSSISGLSMVRNNKINIYPNTPPSNCTGSFFDQIRQQQLSSHKRDTMQAWLSGHHDEFEHMEWDNAMPSERNVLDDTMSFLDGLSKNGSDGGFREDVYLLLKNPDLCCRPLAEIETKMNELRRRDLKQQPMDFMLKDALWLLKPSALCQLAMKYAGNLIYNLTCSGLEWCRFLSVLSAAVVISILNGPDDIRRPVS